MAQLHGIKLTLLSLTVIWMSSHLHILVLDDTGLLNRAELLNIASRKQFLRPQVSSSTTKVSQQDIFTEPTSPQNLTVAFAITVTKCESAIYDGAAVLAESIRQTQTSAYSYEFVAILHYEVAADCQTGLEYLGYKVLLKDLPFKLEELKGKRGIVRGKGCCGVDEYLKLYAYTMTEYDVVVHLDVDVIVLKSLDSLIDVILKGAQSKQSLPTVPSFYTIPENVSFLYTRDYKTLNKNDPHDRFKNGVQGAFFALSPSMDRFESLLRVLKQTEFDGFKGWNRSGFGGYYGSAQIQGLFSYYYFLHHEVAVELNHCRYNTMGEDLRYFPDQNDTCRTGELHCEDCSTTPMEEIYVGHLSSCMKPWWCTDQIFEPRTPVCGALSRRWFELRRDVNHRFKLANPPPAKSNYEKASFGFCRGFGGKDKYISIGVVSTNLSMSSS